MLSSHVPDLGALEVLAAVARTGSLNSAARELGRTQQAVSARIASMEAQTGVSLVVRSPRGSSLTASGVVVAEWAGRLLDAAAEFDAGLTSLRHDGHAHLRVAASLTVAEQLLPGWLVGLRQSPGVARAVPDLAVTLTAVNSGTVAELVRNGTADVGFVEGPRAPKGCRSRVVAHDRLVLVVPPRHAWANRTSPVTPAELARTPLVTREAGSGTREALSAAVHDALRDDVEPASPALELSTTAAVRAAVLAGAGPAVVSGLVVDDDLRARRLRGVAVTGLDLRRALRAVWLGARTPPAGPVRDLVGVATQLGGG